MTATMIDRRRWVWAAPILLVAMVAAGTGCPSPPKHESVGTVPPIGPDGALHDLVTTLRLDDLQRLEVLLADAVPPSLGSFGPVPPTSLQAALALRDELAPILPGGQLVTRDPEIAVRYNAAGEPENAVGLVLATLTRFDRRGRVSEVWEIESEWYAPADRWRLVALRGLRTTPVSTPDNPAPDFAFRRRPPLETPTLAPVMRQ